MVMTIDDALPFIPATPKKVPYFHAIVLIRSIVAHYIVDVTADSLRGIEVEPRTFPQSGIGFGVIQRQML